MAYQYYGKTGYKQNYQGINNILTTEGDQTTEFIMMAYNIKEYSTIDLKEFFDDSIIIPNLSIETLTNMKEQMPFYLESYNIDEDIYRTSLLHKRISKI